MASVCPEAGAIYLFCLAGNPIMKIGAAGGRGLITSYLSWIRINCVFSPKHTLGQCRQLLSEGELAVSISRQARQLPECRILC